MICRVAVLNVINYVLWPLFAAIVALYTMSDAVHIAESSVKAVTVYELPLVPTFYVTGVVLLAVIVIDPVDVAQVSSTVSTNVAVPVCGPLLFVIVPTTDTVYTPAVVGLDHVICLVAVLNVINDVL